MRTKSKISGYIIRGAAYAVFLAVAFIALSLAFQSANSTTKNPSQPRAFSFAERVVYQRAIEDVYWRHGIWPKGNREPKPSLDTVMSQAQLENKVRAYLHDSLVLQDYWHRTITAEQLQAEMDRMARNTKQPEVLQELFEALGNDPAVIAECLARPTFAERLIGDFSAKGETQHVESPQTDAVRTTSVSTTLGQVLYTLPEIADAGDSQCTDNWAATSTSNAPSPRFQHTAVWTGTEMIVWGGNGNTGGRYNPSTDSWTATSLVNAPSDREYQTAVWTGREMIVWGGFSGYWEASTGGRYNPSTNSWTATTTTNAPYPREGHTAVWTGSEMIIWGGFYSDPYGTYTLNTGGRYNPNTNSWTATSTTNAPAPRDGHTAVWTGSEMIVWGGGDGAGNFLGTGGRYNPSTNSWTGTSTINVPFRATAGVWTGSEMIVWGGDVLARLNTGGRYNPSTDSWTATSTTNAPDARCEHTAVWTGSEVIIWGGNGLDANALNTGGRYDPDADTWEATSMANAPQKRELHTAVWTGSEMIVWGGLSVFYSDLNTGGSYCAPGLPAQNISTRAFVQTGDNVMIGGFIVQGTPPKRVIVRAIGPELSQYGVPNALLNPTLELHDGSGALIASNDNWWHTIIGGIITSDQTQAIRNSGYVPGDGRESAIIAELPAGNYTAIVRGVNNTMGVALAEVYDLSPDSNSILANISTRAFVQTGDNVMIGGFIVAGMESKRVIVRAIGPELSQYGVPNALLNPTLELHDGSGALIASNDNWLHTIIGGVITSDQTQAIRNSGHAPGDNRESAIIAELPAGNYTAILRGVNNMMGVALVEVYDLD